MADVKVIIAERDGVDLEFTQEIAPASDTLLATGVKNSSGGLFFTDSTGTISLNDLRSSATGNAAFTTTVNLSAGLNTISHGLSTKDIVVYAYDAANDFSQIFTQVRHATDDSVTIEVASSFNDARVLIVSINTTFTAISGAFADGGVTGGVLFRTSSDAFTSSTSATLSSGGVFTSQGYIDANFAADSFLKTDAAGKLVTINTEIVGKFTSASTTFMADTQYDITHGLDRVGVDVFLVSDAGRRASIDYTILDSNTIRFTPAQTITATVVVQG